MDNSKWSEELMDHKQVNIYADNKEKLIVVAVGIIDKWGGIITEIDVVETFNKPYHVENQTIMTFLHWRNI